MSNDDLDLTPLTEAKGLLSDEDIAIELLDIVTRYDVLSRRAHILEKAADRLQSRRSAPSRDGVEKHIYISEVTTDFCKRIHDKNDHKLAANELIVRKICREFLQLAADVVDLQKARSAPAGEPSPRLGVGTKS